jgi:eukaryotic-like serine/threonine-protein kinase
MDIADLGAEAAARIGMTTPDGWRLCSLERMDLVAADYAARDALGRPAMLRALHAPLAEAPDVARAFGTSARVARCIEHEDTAKVIATGSLAEGIPYVLLTPCIGETVAELVARRPGRVPPAEALRVVRDTLAVLVAAHAAGVVHGALRPDQVIITESGGVKVLGFGTGPLLAEAERALAARPSVMFAAFTPPELCQRSTAQPTFASDLWSTGALLFHLLGRHGAARGYDDRSAHEAPPFPAPRARRRWRARGAHPGRAGGQIPGTRARGEIPQRGRVSQRRRARDDATRGGLPRSPPKLDAACLLSARP